MNMSKIKSILEDRTTSSFGVSIGTGLLLESMFQDYTEERYDDNREIPNIIDIKKYQGWLFNIHTFIRNFIFALNESIELTDTNTKILFEYIEQELITFNNVLELFGVTDYVTMYVPKYDRAIEKFNVDKDINVGYITNNINTINQLKKHIDDLASKYNILVLDSYKLPRDLLKDNKLLTSHYTIDLLNSKNLTLLESNTGKLKEPNEWYTKYHKVGTMDLDYLPMVDTLLYILGDNQLVRGLANKLKKQILQLGIDKKWTIRTTVDKINFDIKRDKELSILIKNFKGF